MSEDIAGTFVEMNIPSEAEAAVPDIACTECGADIAHLYAGRGRKPTKCELHKTKRAASAIGPRGTGDVKAAVNALEQGYNLLSMGLMLLGAREAAATLAQSIPHLSAENAKYLAMDKELVKSINRVGKVSGRSGFVVTQVMTVGPVLKIAYDELAAKAKEGRGDGEPGADSV